LRLRVSRSEVASLLKRDSLEETIHFAPQANAKLTYALEQSASMNALTIQYTENNVTGFNTCRAASTWCVRDQVGIVESLSIGSYGFVDVLIEKDFACLDRNDEENEDAFPNPQCWDNVLAVAELLQSLKRVDLSTLSVSGSTPLTTQFMMAQYA
jgi:hypothetical protein